MPTLTSSNKVIGITLGDPCGIGPEVVAKSLLKPAVDSIAQFVLIGDETILNRYLKKIPSTCRFLPLKKTSSALFIPGQPGKHSGRASLNYLQKAVEMLRARQIDCLVTAPVSKKAISSLGGHFAGHTEYLAQAFKTKKIGMMFVTRTLKVMVATRHIPLREVSRHITQRLLTNNILMARDALKKYFKKKNPRIAVCGLNPHAGEQGTIGKEEITVLIPALEKMRKEGIDLSGPYSADTLFYPPNSRQFDCLIALYHDQGLIALKALEFKNLVNLTLGLPFIRTSPAHGTAFDIAGQNKADASSMTEAILLAAKLSNG